MTRTRVSRAATGTFVGVALVHLGAHVAALGSDDGSLARRCADGSQWLLMPALAAVVASATGSPRSRLVRATLAALALSWLGDSAPDVVGGDAAFLVMIGFFLLAQIAYVVAFVPYRQDSVAYRSRGALAAYVLAVAALVAACAPGAGVLLAPALVYGIVLGASAVLATGVNAVAGWGGALFLVSDAMIALGEFTDWFDFTGHGLAVMATYLAGQALLACGVLRRDQCDEAAYASTR
ncbi:lysoplasmalogenase [Rhodococcus sp. HNM0569]|uniref:lysoplasmalogenase n=1 Tax=Rhodococcus sp. HNM0569 TaxID=2716340 RepID=UPI003211D50E